MNHAEAVRELAQAATDNGLEVASIVVKLNLIDGGHGTKVIKLMIQNLIEKDYVEIAIIFSKYLTHDHRSSYRSLGRSMLKKSTAILGNEVAAQAGLERLVAMYEQLDEGEILQLAKWEKENLTGDSKCSTSDWPGWAGVFKRLHH